MKTWRGQPRLRASNDVDGSPGFSEGDLPPGGFQVPGDVNQDSVLEISDAMRAFRLLFLTPGLPLPCDGETPNDGGNLILLDANDDGLANLADVVHFLNYLFLATPSHALGEGCRRLDGCPEICF